MIVTDRQQELGEWVCQRLKKTYLEGEAQYIGLELKGEIVAVSMWAGFNGASVYSHIAIEGRLNKEFFEFLWFSFYYAFEQLKVKKIIGLVEASNEKALKLDKHLGYEIEATIKDASPTGDLHILTITKSQCKYLEKRYNVGVETHGY